MITRQRLLASVLSIVFLAVFCLIWHATTRPEPPDPELAGMDPEYLELIGASAKGETNPMPGPIEVGQKIWDHLKDPFYYNGANDRGIGSQLLYSLARVAKGYLLAVLIAVPLGFVVGMSPVLSKALDPFIQILKAGLSSGVDAVGALHDQGFRTLFDLRDPHLCDLACSH